MNKENAAPLRPVTPSNGKHHFFGYYDVCPWSMDGSKFLCLETAFMDHAPVPGEKAAIIAVDLRNGDQPHHLADTTAWNWQMGCRLQWLPADPNRRILYNARRDGQFVTVILNIESGQEQILPRPAYAVSRDGKRALTLNFSRLHDFAPGYGYAGIPDPGRDQGAPADDGLFLLDLETGRSKLLLSYEQIVGFEHTAEMDERRHYINHLFWGPDDRRILFLHRWRVDATQVRTRMLTADPDGTSLACVGYSNYISHYDWQHPDRILTWARLGGYEPDYLLVSDPDGKVEPLKANRFKEDGHCSWSPDRTWVLTDGYPDTVQHYSVLLYHPLSDRLVSVADLVAPKELVGAIRCDLHPRWNRDGTAVSFDAAPEGCRQVFTTDVSEFTGPTVARPTETRP